MPTGRSFKEYVSTRFYNNLFVSVEEFIAEKLSSLNLRLNSV